MLEQIGLQLILPLPVRIILRNIARNPVKALLPVFGIALSVSLLKEGEIVIVHPASDVAEGKRVTTES